MNSWCKSLSCKGIIRARSNSTPARPYMARLRVLSLLICPYCAPHPGQKVGCRLSTVTVQACSRRSTLRTFKPAAGDHVIDVFIALSCRIPSQGASRPAHPRERRTRRRLHQESIRPRLTATRHHQRHARRRWQHAAAGGRLSRLLSADRPERRRRPRARDGALGHAVAVRHGERAQSRSRLFTRRPCRSSSRRRPRSTRG